MKLGLREIVFVALLMLIPLGAWWFIYRPNGVANSQMLRQIDAKRAKLQSLNKATGAIGDIKQEIASLEKGIDYLRAKLPSEKEIDKVLKEVWLLAEGNQLTTKSIRALQKNANGAAPSPNSASAALAYSEQPIDMQLEGSFRGYYTFLQSLENQPRIMRIQKMTLHKAKGPEGQVRADFSMSIYFEQAKEL